MDNIYTNFYDPSDEFQQEESRYFCYEIARELISKAKHNNDWYEDINTTKGVLLLLFTWNFAARKTKKINFNNTRQLIKDNKNALKILEKYSIENVNEEAWHLIKNVFEKFKIVFGQTGASKALSLLNPKLFVMWDTKIRKYLNKEIIPGIDNGGKTEHYIIFLKGIQKIISDYKLKEKLPPNSIVAKKIDEYNYIKIIKNKKI